jgi:hypothetical protein
VSSSLRRERWQNLLSWGIGATALLFIFSRFLPSTPPDRYPVVDPVDSGWTQALHEAFRVHLQFGHDIVFTYGPWGFITRGYHPATQLLCVAVWTGLSLVFWLATWRLARHLSGNRGVALLWVLAFAAFATIPAGDDFNARVAAWAALLWFLHFLVDGHRFTLLQGALTVSLGLLSLAKFTALLASAAVVGVIAVDDLSRRRFPWVVLTMLASLLAFWTAAGQHWSGLGAYLVNSCRIASGYTEAMMRNGLHEGLDIAAFLLLGGTLLALTGAVTWQNQRWRSLFAMAGLFALVFLIFKQGFVRHGRHQITSVTGLVLLGLALLAVVPHGKASWLRRAVVALTLACALLAAGLSSRWFAGTGLATQLASSFSFRSLSRSSRAVFPAELRQHFEADAAAVRTQFPLPDIGGNADLYAWYLCPIFAHKIAYCPRPVIQSYAAYTPELAELNSSFLRTGSAPANLLFQVKTIDGRYPSLDDGRSWPELLTLYDIRGTSDRRGTFLVLERSGQPRECSFEALTNVTVHFGQWVPVPAAGEGPIWCEITIKRSLWGEVVSALYKPHALQLTVSLRELGARQFRLVPGMAASGFLLSPLVSDNLAFACLASTEAQKLAGLEITSLRVSADTPDGATACYRPGITIRLYRLLFPRQNLSKITSHPPGAQPRSSAP